MFKISGGDRVAWEKLQYNIKLAIMPSKLPGKNWDFWVKKNYWWEIWKLRNNWERAKTVTCTKPKFYKEATYSSVMLDYVRAKRLDRYIEISLYLVTYMAGHPWGIFNMEFMCVFIKTSLSKQH